MDHLPLPLDPSRRRTAVPYVCRKSWDGGDFLTYPDRAEGDFKHFLRARRIFLYHEQHNPSDDAELAVFLQTWLFFGLLHELFQPWDMYDEEEYIDRDRSEVHTRHLAGRLEAWRVKCIALSQPEKVELEQRLYDRLYLTIQILFCLSPEDKHKNFDPRIRLSLSTLYDTIQYLGLLSFQGDESVSWRGGPTGRTLNNFSDEDIEFMKANGWCPALVHTKSQSSLSNPARWYMSCMRQYSTVQDHGDCDMALCKFEQIQNDDEYQPFHTQECSGCSLVRPDLIEVTKILRSGTFPVLDIVGDDDEVEATVLPYVEGQTYVAISHVWAEGLGNPHELALPACELHRLRDMVTKFLAQEGIKDRAYIWCDTLLCPKDPESQPDAADQQVKDGSIKQLAMSLMRKVYQDSTYTLVLCDALESVNSAGMDGMELGMRVIANNWHQRLWTCQEAALPKKVAYQFADRAVPHVEILAAVRQDMTNSVVQRAICADINTHLVQLRAAIHSDDIKEAILVMMPSYFGLRRCTAADDETLCAGAMLGLDVGIIWKERGLIDRMVCFWKQYCQILQLPQNIIFTEIDRLEHPGFHWAPSTFRSKYPLAITVGQTEDRAAKLVDHGLQVQMPAWRVTPAIPRLSSPKAYVDLLQHMEDSMSLRGVHGEWYELGNAGEKEKREAQHWITFLTTRHLDWHVVLENDVFDENSGSKQALLGFVEKNDAGVNVFRSYLLLNVSKLPESRAELRETSYDVSTYQRQSRQYRRYLICWILVTYYDFALWRPYLKKNKPAYFWMIVFIILLRHHYRYFMAEILRLHNLPASRRLKDLLAREGPRHTVNLVHAHANRIFHGQYAEIRSRYDGSTIWCID